MRRRGTVQLFSTSSIDLLACGLGAVLVLWLLVFGNEGGALEGEQPRGSGELRIRQFGYSHLAGFKLDGYDVLSFSRQDFQGNISAAVTHLGNTSKIFEDTCSETGAGEHFTALFREDGGTSKIEISCKASEDFAKEVSIRFDEMTGAATVALYIQSCKADDEIHYLEVQSIDRRGVNEARYVFHCRNEAVAALSAGRAPQHDWENHFRNQIRQEIGRMCRPDAWPTPFRYQVYDCDPKQDLSLAVSFSGDGAVRLIDPDPKGPPQRLSNINGDAIRDRIVSWAGGTFGSNRPPSLPGCP